MSEENKNTEEQQPEENIQGEIISSEEITVPETEEPETINYKPETEIMETHADHLHKAPGHGCKHYVFEFLMLFLAVFCGFLAENWREHYIEHKRAHEYARSMLDNLQKDTAELKDIISNGQIAVNNLDTFLILVNQADDILQVPTGKLYWYGLWGGYLRGFESNDATFQQMKGSGSLRYFNNAELEKKLGDYDQKVRSMTQLNEIDRNIFVETRKARSRIFSYRYNAIANTIVRQFSQGGPNLMLDSFIRSNPPLLTNDKVQLNEYIELCRSRNLRQQLNNAIVTRELATEIIELLKKEYHLVN